MKMKINPTSYSLYTLYFRFRSINYEFKRENFFYYDFGEKNENISELKQSFNFPAYFQKRYTNILYPSFWTER